MRIVVGLHGTADGEYLDRLLAAGADEFFIGYVPSYWHREFGFEFSPNRRYYQATQVTSEDRLEAMCSHARKGGADLSLAFNEHFVTRTAWKLGQRLLDEAIKAGVTSVIVADPSIIPWLRKEHPELHVHVSGDAGIYNRDAASLCFDLGARRIIFPRELQLAELSGIVKSRSAPGREFEAFVMGEPCVFDGARCFTEHGYNFGCDFCNFHSMKLLGQRGKDGATALEPPHSELLNDPRLQATRELGKCGLCAIPLMRSAGVTHLKVPGRASAAVAATNLVRRMLDRTEATSLAARGLLEAPALCDSREFCYYPELEEAVPGEKEE